MDEGSDRPPDTWRTGHESMVIRAGAQDWEPHLLTTPMVEPCMKGFQRAARQLANLRLARAKTARARRRDHVRTLKTVKVA